MDYQQAHGRSLAPDTPAIVACASAPGRAAIAVLRVSGPALHTLAEHLAQKTLVPREATLCVLYDAGGQMLDQVLLIYFPAPYSYTGEDVLEIQCHGGTVVVDMILTHVLQVAQAAGMALRLARPGEFSERAFLSGKIDLAQAEAVADLINASSQSAAQSASRSLQGAFSTLVHALLAALTRLRVLVEASFDFPEEEAIDLVHLDQINTELSALYKNLTHTLEQAQQGALLQEGVRVVIAGQPNAGKSSLFNTLAEAELAIVTPIAGTTRDKIEKAVHIHGVPVHIMDTAGLTQSQDTVERIGIDLAWQAIQQADIVLFLRDVSTLHNTKHQDAKITAQLPQGVPVLHVYNKVDLPHSAALPEEKNSHAISCKTQQGIDSLRQAILAECGYKALPEGVFMARKRHVQALQQSQRHVQQAQTHLNADKAMLDLAAEELRLAQNALGEITGRFTSDDLLGTIFATFCIGK